MCKHCWDDDQGNKPHHKDFIRGWSDDGFEETPHKKKSKKKSPKKKPGCPGNDGRSHVYVYTTEFNIEDLFFRYFGFHKYERKFCAGCGKRSYDSRKTERYLKKFKNSSRWGSPEYQHEGFRAYRAQWLTQRGWTPEVYGNGW